MKSKLLVLELLQYDPDDLDTYPSVCLDRAEVESRFGFTGGEKLLFDQRGSYVGQLVKEVGEPAEERSRIP